MNSTMNMFLALFYYLVIYAILLTVSLFIIINAVFLYIVFILDKVSTNGVCKSNARLDNKVVLVTGGNTGIGLETARDLASRGARVLIACRDGKKAAEAIADIIQTTGNNNIEYQYLDLASFASIRKFAEDFKKKNKCLDILISNAGFISFMRSFILFLNKTTEDGIDMSLQVNYLCPFLLTNLLLNEIKSSRDGRIILTTSCAHFFGRISPNSPTMSNGLFKYCDSRLCEVLWMKALAKRLPSNVTVNSLHPGIVSTNLKGLEPFILSWFISIYLKVLNFKTPKEGAQTTIYLAVSEEVAGVSGKYFVDYAEAKYSLIADNDEMVEYIWNKSLLLTKK